MAVDDVVRRAIHLYVQDPAQAGSGYHTYLNQETGGATPFADLLLAVFNSILEVFLLCAAGYILARQGILDKKTQKQINRLNVSLFTPALLFSKVAFYLTPEKLKELWVIPIWFIIVTGTSMVVGRALGWSFGLRKSQRSFVMAAAMFMNSNALPIALMQSLVVSVPDLAWGSDDNKNAMLGRALTYLTMYSTLGMVVRYSYGVSLLSRADTILAPANLLNVTAPSTSILGLDADREGAGEQTPLLIHEVDEDEDEEQNGLRTQASSSTLVQSASKTVAKGGRGQFTESPTSSAPSSPRISPVSAAATAAGPGRCGKGVQQYAVGQGRDMRPPPERRNTTFYNSFPNSPNESRADLPAWSVGGGTGAGAGAAVGSGRGAGAVEGRSEMSDSEVDDEDEVEVERDLNGTADLEHGAHTHTHSRSLLSKFLLFLRPIHTYIFHPLRTLLLAIHAFLTVPLYAALLSLIVALAPPLQHALEHSAALRPVNGAIGMCGKCAVPVTLVVLGGYFWGGDEEAKEEGVKKKQKQKTKKDGRGWLQRVKDLLHVGEQSPWVMRKREERAKAKAQDNGRKPGETKTVVLAISARMLITPLVLTPLMVLATKSDWHAVFEDPIFVVVNTLLLCSPPALTLAQITSADASGGSFERLISRTIFWSYCVFTPVVMLGSVLGGLWLAEL